MAKSVTLREIADALGLSPTTVSFVLNNRQDKGISEETRNRVIAKAAELGYRKLSRPFLDGWNRVAYLTKRIESFNFYTSFFSGVYSHLQRKSSQHKLDFLLMELDPSEGETEAAARLQEILHFGISAFLSNNRETVRFLLANGLKAILVQGGTMDDCTCVHCNDREAGRVAAFHAFELGHREAGMIFPSASSTRYTGFLECFEERGGRCPESFRWILPMDHDLLEASVAERIPKSGNVPTIFYCFADNMLFPVIRGLARVGLKVPDDISLIGTDNLYWGRYAHPAFTTVDLSEELFADNVIDAIHHVLRDGLPYSLAVPVSLVARETTRQPRPR